MSVSSFIKERRRELKISQEDLAYRLTNFGFDTSRSAISHWEQGKYYPPLDNPKFANALASALEMNVRSVLIQAGYDFQVEGSDVATKAAALIDKMPPSRQMTALVLLEQLLKEGG